MSPTIKPERKRPWQREREKNIKKFGNEHYSIYNSPAWRKFAKAVKADSPLCIRCKDQDKLTPADVVDHVIPITQGGEIYDVKNLQTLCHPCHNSKRAKEKKYKNNSRGRGGQILKQKI